MELENIINYIYFNTINVIVNESFNPLYLSNFKTNSILCNDCCGQATVSSNYSTLRKKKNSTFNHDFRISNSNLQNHLCLNEVYTDIDFNNSYRHRKDTNYFKKFNIAKRIRIFIKRIFVKKIWNTGESMIRTNPRNAMYLTKNESYPFEDFEVNYAIETKTKSVLERLYEVKTMRQKKSNDKNSNQFRQSLLMSCTDRYKKTIPTYNQDDNSYESMLRETCLYLSNKANQEDNMNKAVHEKVESVSIKSENNSAIKSLVNFQPIRKCEMPNAEILLELTNLRNELRDLKLQNIQLFTKGLELSKLKTKNNKIRITNKISNENEIDTINCQNQKSNSINSNTSRKRKNNFIEEEEMQATRTISRISSNNMYESDMYELSDNNNKKERQNKDPSQGSLTNLTEVNVPVKLSEKSLALVAMENKLNKPYDSVKRNFRKDFIQATIKNSDETRYQTTDRKEPLYFTIANEKSSITNDTVGTNIVFSLENRTSHLPIKPSNIDVGDIVRFTRDGIRVCLGLVRYIGELPYQTEIFLGLELERDDGLHDGVYCGTRYFNCANNRGVFVSFQRVMMVFK